MLSNTEPNKFETEFGLTGLVYEATLGGWRQNQLSAFG